ncbi:MAG: LysR family transcriptional regulator [Polyangiaceae bacterium]|nr:LysR family transcriptional regulator [Polyangiaceae bacterium]
MDRIEAMRLFTRLVERGSFSAAAKDLKVKQSTASKWVAELEEQLGVSLVERTTRAIRITDAGRRFHAGCQAVLGTFDELSAELRDQSLEPSGHLRVSLPVTFGTWFAAPLVADYLTCFPKVSIEILLSDRYVNLVEEGIDLALRVGVPVDTSARGRRLLDGGRRLVAAPDYLKRHAKPKAPEDLAQHTCLRFSEVGTGPVWSFTDEDGTQHTVSVRGPHATNNAEVLLLMAKRGMGITLLADWLVRDAIKRKELVALLPNFAPPPAPIYALTPGNRYVSIAVRSLIAHLEAGLRRELRGA